MSEMSEEEYQRRSATERMMHRLASAKNRNWLDEAAGRVMRAERVARRERFLKWIRAPKIKCLALWNQRWSIANRLLRKPPINKRIYSYSWRKFEKDCCALETWVRWSLFDSIYGIPKGGLIVAARLAYMRNLPIVSYEEISSKTLIVDDVWGTGRTMTEFLQKVPAKYCATLVLATAPNCRAVHTHHIRDIDLFFAYGRHVPEHVFVLFPWAPEDRPENIRR